MISIVTISYNSLQYIEQTIQSVVNQDWADKEYIIIDGGSTDGTVDIIKKYEAHIDQWISEPDEGIAEAMNKGLKRATGDFVIFLHSDDYFLNENILSQAVSYLNSDSDIFLYDIYLSNNGKKKIAKPRGLNWWLNFKTGVFHQSSICSLALFEKNGYFDTNLMIAMDYDFFLRAYRAGFKAKKIDMPLSVMRLVGKSSKLDRQSLRERFAEEKKVHMKHCSSFFLRIVYFVYWTLYPIYRYIKS